MSSLDLRGIGTVLFSPKKANFVCVLLGIRMFLLRRRKRTMKKWRRKKSTSRGREKEKVFCKHYFSPLNTFTRQGKAPDPYLGLTYPGGPKTYGSGKLAQTLPRYFYWRCVQEVLRILIQIFSLRCQIQHKDLNLCGWDQSTRKNNIQQSKGLVFDYYPRMGTTLRNLRGFRSTVVSSCIQKHEKDKKHFFKALQVDWSVGLKAITGTIIVIVFFLLFLYL